MKRYNHSIAKADTIIAQMDSGLLSAAEARHELTRILNAARLDKMGTDSLPTLERCIDTIAHTQRLIASI